MSSKFAHFFHTTICNFNILFKIIVFILSFSNTFRVLIPAFAPSYTAFDICNNPPVQSPQAYKAKTLANVAKSVTILTNGDELVENRDEALDEFIIEDRGILIFYSNLLFLF